MAIDNIDRSILKLLQINALATLKDISKQVNLSLSPTHDRVKRLEAEGYIQQYVALLDRKKLELGLVVHLFILERQIHSEVFAGEGDTL